MLLLLLLLLLHPQLIFEPPVSGCSGSLFTRSHGRHIPCPLPPVATGRRFVASIISFSLVFLPRWLLLLLLLLLLLRPPLLPLLLPLLLSLSASTQKGGV
jgi:hypothetical protein